MQTLLREKSPLLLRLVRNGIEFLITFATILLHLDYAETTNGIYAKKEAGQFENP